LAGIFAQELTVEIGKLQDEGFGAVVFFADHDPEGAKGVEEEMGVDLLFQDFKAGAEVLVLKLCVGKQDILFLGEGGEGSLDG
jgi:hypothetical protein